MPVLNALEKIIYLYVIPFDKRKIIMEKKLLIIIVIIIICSSFVLASIITVNILKPNKPKAIITISSSFAFVNETIQFSGINSSGNVVSWIWDFGDGQVASGKTITHRYNSSSYFNVSLIVKDKDGKSDMSIQNISIQNIDIHEEVSGTNLFRIIQWGEYFDIIYFPVLKGITKPTIYANWSGHANLADLVVALGVRDGTRYFVEERYVINDEFNINAVIEPSEIEDFGEHDILIAVREGNLDNYFMEVDVHY